MTLKLAINPDAEARLRQLAEQSGKDLDAYVSELVEHAASLQPSNGANSAADFDHALDELFDGDTRKLPTLPLSYSREDIYNDHD